MLAGVLMVLAPILVYLVSLPFSRRLRPVLRRTYRIGGGLVVFLGGGMSLYLASYTGDQGGIAAFFFQSAVILVYVAFSVSVAVLNWFIAVRDYEGTDYRA